MAQNQNVICYKYYIHLTAFSPGQPGKPAPEMKQEMMEWQWHPLNHVQIICTLLQTDNHASIPPLSFLQTRCPSCCLTNSIKALKGSEGLWDVGLCHKTKM